MSRRTKPNRRWLGLYPPEPKEPPRQLVRPYSRDPAIQAAFVQGQQSGLRGNQPYSCRYPKNSPQRKAWYAGYFAITRRGSDNKRDRPHHTPPRGQKSKPNRGYTVHRLDE